MVAVGKRSKKRLKPHAESGKGEMAGAEDYSSSAGFEDAAGGGEQREDVKFGSASEPEPEEEDPLADIF